MTSALAEVVRPIAGPRDYDSIIERAQDTRFALIGEASHGTHEFYRERAEITKRLIMEAGVTAVAAEADWPDAYRVNLYVRGESDDGNADEALSDFRRFPAWMWRNTDVLDFVTWLRKWNDELPPDSPKIGFYGLDLYSLHTSMNAVVEYLESIDPEAAARARSRYSCFDHFGPDPQVYAYQAGVAGAESCEQEVVEQLLELQQKAAEKASEDHFFAEQNARLVVNAERYYRSVFRGSVGSWNLRDGHMAETLDALTAHLEKTSGPTKVAVWAHNSHVGDARATAMGTRGELNIGQLVRERHEDETLLVGFTTFTGTVTAASDWGGVAERKHVRPALAGSWEELFHEDLGGADALIDTGGLTGQGLERAIGVIYLPQTERQSHYFEATIGRQFDAVIHLDETHAVEPLEYTSIWVEGELPETYPFAV
jgi:erythromycin esterase-like protein